jgi:hypothetical protein
MIAAKEHKEHKGKRIPVPPLFAFLAFFRGAGSRGAILGADFEATDGHR